MNRSNSRIVALALHLKHIKQVTTDLKDDQTFMRNLEVDNIN